MATITLNGIQEAPEAMTVLEVARLAGSRFPRSATMRRSARTAHAGYALWKPKARPSPLSDRLHSPGSNGLSVETDSPAVQGARRLSWNFSSDVRPARSRCALWRSITGSKVAGLAPARRCHACAAAYVCAPAGTRLAPVSVPILSRQARTQRPQRTQVSPSRPEPNLLPTTP